MESKKDAFRKYLEGAGVIDAITKGKHELGILRLLPRRVGCLKVQVPRRVCERSQDPESGGDDVKGRGERSLVVAPAPLPLKER